MSKTYRRVGEPMTKREAVIKMLSESWTRIAHAAWPDGQFIWLRFGSVQNEKMRVGNLSEDYSDALEWYIVEEVTESPEKAELRRIIEEAEAKIAEAKAKLEALP